MNRKSWESLIDQKEKKLAVLQRRAELEREKTEL